MSIKTNPTTSLAGTFWFEINAPNTNANVTVHKMGDISYEFDLVPSDSVVRGIGGIQGSMQVDFFDQLSNMGSLYGSLENSIGTYDGLTATTVPVAPTMLYLLPRGESNIENAYRWPFDLRFTEVSIDERSQTTKATFIPRSTNINIATWNTGLVTNNFPASDVRFRYNGSNYQAYYVGDFIYDIVSDFDTSVGNTTIYRPSGGLISELLSNDYVPYIPTKDFVATSNYSNFFPAMMVLGPDQQYASGNLAVDKVASYAAIDGSIFGSAFGVNFFMGKRNTLYNVEISNSEVSDLKFKPSPRSTNAVIYRLTNTNVINSTTNMGNGFPALFNTFAEQPAWLAASQQINIGVSVYSPHLNFGRTSNVDTNYVNGDAAYDSFLFAFPGLTETLWTADATYTTSFATGSFTSNAGIYMIEADILGVDKLRPYEVIKFDNTVPLRYQNKHFRPTSVSYDLKADRVRVSAYEIGTFEVVPPEPPPPEFDGIFALSNYKYVLEESEIANNLIVFNENGSRNTSFSDKYFGKDVMILACEELSSNRLGVINALSQFIVYESSGEVEIIVDLADIGFNINTFDFNNNVNFMGYNIKETIDNDYILSIRTKTTDTPSYNAVIKILADGSMDEVFVPYTYIADFADDIQYIASIQLQSNGKIIIAGSDNIASKGLLLRLDTDGTEDDTFNKITYSLDNMNSIVTDIKVLSDDSILVVGDFTEYDEESYGRIIKLDADGDLVASFNEDGTGFNAIVRQIEVNTTTNIITVSGDFTSYNGTACPSIVKLNADGSLNTFFTYDEISDVYYKRVCVLSDGSIVIGYLPEDDPLNYKINFAKIDDDGSVDTTFQSIELRIAGQGFESKVYGLVEISGKLFIGGSFSIYNVSEESNKTADGGYFDNDKKALLFFNSNGEITSTFFDDTDLGGGVTNKNIGIQSNEKYIYGYNRFNADGTIDDTFTVQTGTANIICVQEDDKILVYDGSILERLLDDGALDTAFNTNAASVHTEFESIVFIGLASTNKIFIGGLVDSSTGDIKIIRLNADGTTDNTYEFEYNVGGAITDFYCAVDPSDRVVVACALFNITIEDAQDIVPVVIRVNSSGVLDSTFTLSESMLVLPSAVSVQSDSKIIIYGQQLKYFSNYVAPTEPVRQSFGTGIARLNANGTIDTSFTVPSLIRNSSLFGYSNGKVVSNNDVVLNGDFSFYNTTIGGGIALLGSNGTRVNSFNQKVIYPIIWNSAFL